MRTRLIWLIPFEEETKIIFEILKHPEEYLMPCFLAVGHPLNPDSEATRQEKTTNRCAIKPCPFRAAVCFYSVTQGGGASAFALGCYAPALQAGRAR